jgi:hypothetical protein
MTTNKKTQECTELMMNKKDSATELPREDNRLDHRYGKIGIPAVAAAVAYQSEVKNPAYAPVVPDAEKWLTEFAMA